MKQTHTALRFSSFLEVEGVGTEGGESIPFEKARQSVHPPLLISVFFMLSLLYNSRQKQKADRVGQKKKDRRKKKRQSTKA